MGGYSQGRRKFSLLSLRYLEQGYSVSHPDSFNAEAGLGIVSVQPNGLKNDQEY
jgi:hypothetical protein